MHPLDYKTINPGIRETVRLLRDNGFNTCDSGDGSTREFECDPGYPYVGIEVSPERLVAEADRLVGVLAAAGVVVEEMDEDGTRPAIQADYHPVARKAFVVLINVKDADLAAGRRA